MSDDPYKVLGVAKTATQDEIKKAYRKLAKTLHPDLHPGDAGKQAEFQAVSAAYDLLGDADKRKRFDAGEIDASGQERPEAQFYHHYAGQNAGRRYDPGGAGGYDDMSDLFSELFGRRGGGGGFRGDFDARGADLRYHVEVEFLEAARGGKRTFTMPDGGRLEISIPAGVQEGQILRLRGKGAPGSGKGPAGDALVTVSVTTHPVFKREGSDIEVELPITVDEAVLGGKVTVPTIWGDVSMRIPKGASSGRRLRLKGKGIKAKAETGDQVVRLRIVLPEKIDPDMEELALRWRKQAGFDPRAELRRRT
ncbi:DnaJ domain-containing protein [Tranquillimonas rosea]|uniref:DnaJ domain-containing protein n=1 Tax=Tranquillimonas rosea TaxID=641238 RepID=A0A1H9P416_9RHOB|nr:DnaJ C-terminal domain-containing protein [Tranquillimonas rosea]SER42918.1 DnaJ domain-containing protein [Tranquillimonas rosea]